MPATIHRKLETVMAHTQFQQKTLAHTVRFDGVGLHSGKTVQVEIRPAAANTGILFQRTDLPGQPYIAAKPNAVFDTSLATRIGTPSSFRAFKSKFYVFNNANE